MASPNDEPTLPSTLQELGIMGIGEDWEFRSVHSSAMAPRAPQLMVVKAT